MYALYTYIWVNSMVNDRKIIPVTCILWMLVQCFNYTPGKIDNSFPLFKVTENRNLEAGSSLPFASIFQGASWKKPWPWLFIITRLQTATKQQVEIHDFHQDKDLAARPILGETWHDGRELCCTNPSTPNELNILGWGTCQPEIRQKSAVRAW